jgi:phosphatidate cytidylyltransferase
VSDTTLDRLFGFLNAFDDPVTAWLTGVTVAILLVAPAVFVPVLRLKKVDTAGRSEIRKRYLSWLVITPLLILPVLAGAATTMIGVAILSLACYREYARATGLFRERAISATIVVGIALVTFAVLDNWYGLFLAMGPHGVAAIAIIALAADRPKGYIQRVAMGTLGFLLFGVCLSHIGFMANDPGYRPIVLMLLLTVETNDIFAFISGKTFGRRKLAPNTSPNKTFGGAIGAMVLTTTLTAALGHFIFRGTPLDDWAPLIGLGIVISGIGQCGDLMFSSIKRDLGIKDIGATIPGHGGMLDRFDSLILVAPAVFHYVAYFHGFDFDETTRIISGG